MQITGMEEYDKIHYEIDYKKLSEMLKQEEFELSYFLLLFEDCNVFRGMFNGCGVDHVDTAVNQLVHGLG